jgi:hypothetical protein
MTLAYTLMVRLPDGTQVEDSVEHVQALNKRAQEHISQGHIILGYAYPDMQSESGRRVYRSGTRHFGKERK